MAEVHEIETLDIEPPEARRRLYEIVRAESPFEATVERALWLGAAYLDVDNGHLTRIDPEMDHWEVIASTDPDGGRVPTGLVVELQETYCRRAIEEYGSIALRDARNQGGADDPDRHRRRRRIRRVVPAPRTPDCDGDDTIGHSYAVSAGATTATETL